MAVGNKEGKEKKNLIRIGPAYWLWRPNMKLWLLEVIDEGPKKSNSYLCHGADIKSNPATSSNL